MLYNTDRYKMRYFKISLKEIWIKFVQANSRMKKGEKKVKLDSYRYLCNLKVPRQILRPCWGNVTARHREKYKKNINIA